MKRRLRTNRVDTNVAHGAYDVDEYNGVHDFNGKEGTAYVDHVVATDDCLILMCGVRWHRRFHAQLSCMLGGAPIDYAL